MLYGLNCKEVKNISYVKEKYIEGYNVIVTEDSYDKYSELENIIIKEISKIELQLDEYIYKTRLQYKDIILGYIEKLKDSKSYQNFQELESILQSIEMLEELIKLYGSDCELEDKITRFKFDVLYRKQVEELVYQNGGKDSKLIQYQNEREKNIFIEMLEEKIKSLHNSKGENDGILNIELEAILNDAKLLERLIVLDMDKNPFNYINLVMAPIFNAHLCNIGNNPFEKEIYAGNIGNKANFSILYAILNNNIITNENISIVECERLYQKFGFKCRPIIIGIGQRFVKMIFDKVHNSERFKQMMSEVDETKSNKKEGYCKISFKGLSYNFDYEEKEDTIEDLKQEIIDSKLFSDKCGKRKNKKSSNDPNYVDVKVEQIEKMGVINTNIDVIISLIQDIINKESNIGKRDNKFIDILNKDIKSLEKLKNKQLSLEEKISLLLEINRLYLTSNIKHNVWGLLPLEYMERFDFRMFDRKIESEPIPTEEWPREELWEKYKADFKKLGIDVLKSYFSVSTISSNTSSVFSKIYSEPHFEIYINLADISDLPIDYERIQMVSKQKIDEIIKGEEEVEIDG